VSVALAALGVYDVNSTQVPTIQYGILLPIVVGALLIWRSETAKRIIAAMPQPWIVGVQLYRALGVIFLIRYAAGKLPSLFAWPAGTGDIVIGLLAPIVGLAYTRAPRNAASLVAAWNVFGILDLIVAVGTGFATAPSLIQPIEVQPTSELMTMLPLVLVPVYLVPLSIVLHLASLAKLRREAPEDRGRIAAARAYDCRPQHERIRSPTMSTALSAFLIFVGVGIAVWLLSCVVEALRSVSQEPRKLRWAPELPIEHIEVDGIRLRRTGKGPNLMLLHT